MDIQTGKPYEVNKAQYNHAKSNYVDYCAHRKEGGKFYIKFLTLAGLSKAKVEQEFIELN